MDEHYQARASRQRRILVIVGVLVVMAACAFFAINNTFYDRCTASFNRDPQAVVSSYLDAISKGDLNRVQNCWVRANYFDINSGCSELCLSRVLGTAYAIKKVDVGQPVTAENGRGTIQAGVTVTCPGGADASGEITLDAVAGGVPWKHWRVARSTIGGSATQPWCK